MSLVPEHMSGPVVYQKLSSKQIEVSRILKFHFERIVRSVNRKIVFRQSFTRPWTVEVSEPVSLEIFYEWFKAVSDFSNFGRTVSIIRNKKREPKEYRISFTHFGTFKFHINEAAKLDDIVEFFSKKNTKTGEKAKVVVSESDPVEIIYKISTSSVSLKLKYIVQNRYGNVCSF